MIQKRNFEKLLKENQVNLSSTLELKNSYFNKNRSFFVSKKLKHHNFSFNIIIFYYLSRKRFMAPGYKKI